MKRHITAAIIIILFFIFSIFIAIRGRYARVVNVISPVKIQIINNDKKSANTETICISGVEAFSLTSDEIFDKEYTKSLNITTKEIVSLGYLANEYSQKLLLNKKISLKFTGENLSDCKVAKVKLDGMDYSKILSNSGYGVLNGKVGNRDKFKENLKKARKLNLVILNHHSGKYHTLDCPYGKASHDMVILPENQLPKDALPCKFCHNIVNEKQHKKLNYIHNIENIIKPNNIIEDSGIKIIFTDYTTNLRPNNQCNTNICHEIVKLINETKNTLDIAIYGYDENPAITNALKSAKARGVKIRYVYDTTHNKSEEYYRDNKIITDISERFNNDKSDIKAVSNMIMHNKFMIFDNHKVLTGSMNISSSGLSDFDINNIVIISSEEIATIYRQEFEQMLNGRFHKNKIKLNKKKYYDIGNSTAEIYFAPKDDPVTRITQLINTSKQYVYMPTFLITHRKIADSLIAAKKRGVDVRVIIDANGANTSHSKHQLLRESGIILKTENYAGKLHAKSIIIDDEYIITGSMNFSYSGAEKNDENVLIINNKVLAKGFKDFFLYIWTKIPNKYLKQNVHPESKESIGSCSDGVDNNFNGLIDNEEKLCR